MNQRNQGSTSERGMSPNVVSPRGRLSAIQGGFLLGPLRSIKYGIGKVYRGIMSAPDLVRAFKANTKAKLTINAGLSPPSPSPPTIVSSTTSSSSSSSTPPSLTSTTSPLRESKKAKLKAKKKRIRAAAAVTAESTAEVLMSRVSKGGGRREEVRAGGDDEVSAQLALLTDQLNVMAQTLKTLQVTRGAVAPTTPPPARSGSHPQLTTTRPEPRPPKLDEDVPEQERRNEKMSTNEQIRDNDAQQPQAGQGKDDSDVLDAHFPDNEEDVDDATLDSRAQGNEEVDEAALQQLMTLLLYPLALMMEALVETIRTLDFIPTLATIFGTLFALSSAITYLVCTTSLIQTPYSPLTYYLVITFPFDGSNPVLLIALNYTSLRAPQTMSFVASFVHYLDPGPPPAQTASLSDILYDANYRTFGGLVIYLIVLALLLVAATYIAHTFSSQAALKRIQDPSACTVVATNSAVR